MSWVGLSRVGYGTFQFSDLVKFVMFALVSRVHMMFYILRKRYTVSRNQGTHDKLNHIPQLHTYLNGLFTLGQDHVMSSVALRQSCELFNVQLLLHSIGDQNRRA